MDRGAAWPEGCNSPSDLIVPSEIDLALKIYFLWKFFPRLQIRSCPLSQNILNNRAGVL